MKSSNPETHRGSNPDSGRNPAVAAAISPGEGHRRHNKVLVVDDDASVRESLKKLLREAGYAVSLAANGQDALERLRGQTLDLLILDLGLPTQSGWDIFEHIANEDPALPVIILTGRANQIRLAAAAGVGALLEKPVDPSELLRTISEVIAEPRNVRLRRVHGRTQKIRYLPSGDTVFAERIRKQHDTRSRASKGDNAGTR